MQQGTKAMSCSGISSPDEFLVITTTRKCGTVMRLTVSVCLCVYVSVLFGPELESLFLAHMFILRTHRASSYIKVVGSRSRSQEQKRPISITKYKHSL